MQVTRQVATVLIIYMIPAVVAWSLSPRSALQGTFNHVLCRKTANMGRWRHGDSIFRLYSSAMPVNGKKRVVFLGTPEVAATTLRSIYEHSKEDNSPYDLVAVITQPPKKQGRNNKLVPSPVAVAAEELGVLAMCPAKVGEGNPNVGNC
jgi:hypothetical protein